MSAYGDALLRARQLILPLDRKPCFSSRESENDDMLNSDRATSKISSDSDIAHADALAHGRLCSAVNLMTREHVIYKRRCDGFLDECDRLDDICNDLEAHILEAEARVAAVRQSQYTKWSRNNNGPYSEHSNRASKDFVQLKRELLASASSSSSLRSKLTMLERNLCARQLHKRADTLSYLQASTFEKGVGEK